MASRESINSPRRWEECPRDPEVSPRWQSMYVTIKPDGELMLSRVTHEAMGAPAGYVLLFDRERMCIGLRPANPEKSRMAYPARPRGDHGGRRIRASRLLNEFGLRIPVTLRFPRAQKNKDGILILDLNDTEPVTKPRQR